jgi:hypothetical protein
MLDRSCIENGSVRVWLQCGDRSKIKLTHQNKDALAGELHGHTRVKHATGSASPHRDRTRKIEVPKQNGSGQNGQDHRHEQDRHHLARPGALTRFSLGYILIHS